MTRSRSCFAKPATISQGRTVTLPFRISSDVERKGRSSSDSRTWLLMWSGFFIPCALKSPSQESRATIRICTDRPRTFANAAAISSGVNRRGPYNSTTRWLLHGSCSKTAASVPISSVATIATDSSITWRKLGIASGTLAQKTPPDATRTWGPGRAAAPGWPPLSNAAGVGDFAEHQSTKDPHRRG